MTKRAPSSWFYALLCSSMAIVLASLLSGCEASDPNTLTLLCGGAIRPPMTGAEREDEKGVIERFRDVHPGANIETNFGASNILLGQLKLTQRGDLFFPGDDFYVEEAKREGLVYETRTVARFVPVIMAANGNPLDIREVSDLADPNVRLAIADPRAAAIGRITPEIFEKNGVSFDALDNIEFTGVTAPEVAQAVELGHVDATITWRPVAEQYHHNSTVIEIPPEDNVLSPLVIAVLETSRNKELAVQFADFIAGPEGREVFQRYHYDVE